VEGLKIRFSVEEDKTSWMKWLAEPGVLRWFPMCNEMEIEDAARLLISYAKYNAVLTAEFNGEPCGLANLYLQPYRKLAHQCLFSIIVAESHRGKGIGTALMTELMALAKERFNLEILHLEVYEGNPARRLYQRLGFVDFGFQRHFIKENGEYIGKHYMQKIL
jgi:RimJ/RimL family protein N-acetyltransferase